MLVRPSGAAPSPTPEEISAFKEAYGLYVAGRFQPALDKLNDFEKNFPLGAQLAQAENLHGLVFLLGKQPQQSILHFKRSIELANGNRTFIQYVLYNLAKAQFEAGLTDDALKSLLDIQPDVLDNDNKIKVHYLKAKVYSAKGVAIEAVREALSASRLFSNTALQSQETRNSLVSLIEKTLGQLNNLPAEEKLYGEFQDAPIADALLFHLGSRELAMGGKEVGANHLRALMTTFPQSSYYPMAAELLKSSVQDTGPVDSSAIGVLLPMRGRFAAFGEKSLKGIELAFDIFNPDKPDPKITLVVEDSGEEAEQTIKALDRLVTGHHVLAVIGPLLSKGIDQITQHAQDLGVPLISLARYPGIQGEWVFQGGLTLKQQSQQLAKFAINSLGMKQFAIMYPQGKVGEEAGRDFWNSVEAMGGQIRGVETYGPSETDFRQQVDKLSGLFYPEARALELEGLAKLRNEMKITKRTRKTEQYYALKPIVDYDAVFVPDDAKISGQILPTFAYRDVDKVKFLGTSVWNTPELATRAQNASESSIFTDVFFVGSDSPVVQRFVERYHNTFGEDPSSIEATAHDVAKVLEHTLVHGTTRAELRDRLKQVSGVNGVTGKIQYADGSFIRDLKFLTVKNGKIIPYIAPPSGKTNN